MKKSNVLLILMILSYVSFSQHFVPGYSGQPNDAMSLIVTDGQIGIIQLEAGDELAAFDGNLCCGVVTLTTAIVPGDDTTYPTLLASADDGDGGYNGFGSGNKIYIRIWDNSGAGVEYYNVVVDFVDNTTGLTKDPVPYTSSGSEFVKIHTANLQKTWNAYSTTSWDDGGSWDPEGVPEVIHNVIIPVVALGNPTIPNNSEASCGSLNLVSGTELTIASSSTGTGSLIVAGSVSGTGSVTSRRFLSTDVWQMVSSAVSGQSISNFLTTSAIATKDAARGMIDYIESTDDWSDFYTNSKGGDITAGKGFGMRATSSLLLFKGTLNNGDYVIPVTRDKFGWNLIGNPYSSSIYIKQEVEGFLIKNEAILDQSFKAIYLWNPTVNSGSGGYVVINNVEGQANLASGQGFFIKAASAGNISFNKAMQVHKSDVPFKSAIIPNSFIKIISNFGDLESSTKVIFNKNMTIGLDPSYDAGLLKSGNGFDVYSQLVSDNGVNFAIQALPGNSNDNYIIPIGVDAVDGGNITFSMQMLNLPQGYQVILEDKLTETFTVFNNSEVKYTTTIESNTKGTGRFYAHVGVSVNTKIRDLSREELTVYTVGQDLYIKGNIGNNALFSIYSVNGRLMKKVNGTPSHINKVNIAGYPQGVYLLKVQDDILYKPVKFIIGSQN